MGNILGTPSNSQQGVNEHDHWRAEARKHALQRNQYFQQSQVSSSSHPIFEIHKMYFRSNVVPQHYSNHAASHVGGGSAYVPGMVTQNEARGHLAIDLKNAKSDVMGCLTGSLQEWPQG